MIFHADVPDLAPVEELVAVVEAESVPLPLRLLLEHVAPHGQLVVLVPQHIVTATARQTLDRTRL